VDDVSTTRKGISRLSIFPYSNAYLFFNLWAWPMCLLPLPFVGFTTVSEPLPLGLFTCWRNFGDAVICERGCSFRHICSHDLLLLFVLLAAIRDFCATQCNDPVLHLFSTRNATINGSLPWVGIRSNTYTVCWRSAVQCWTYDHDCRSRRIHFHGICC